MPCYCLVSIENKHHYMKIPYLYIPCAINAHLDNTLLSMYSKNMLYVILPIKNSKDISKKSKSTFFSSILYRTYKPHIIKMGYKMRGVNYEDIKSSKMRAFRQNKVKKTHNNIWKWFLVECITPLCMDTILKDNKNNKSFSMWKYFHRNQQNEEKI